MLSYVSLMTNHYTVSALYLAMVTKEYRKVQRTCHRHGFMAPLKA